MNTAEALLNYIFSKVEKDIQELETLGENDERYHTLFDSITATIDRVTGGKIEFSLIPIRMDNNKTSFTVQFGKLKE